MGDLGVWSDPEYLEKKRRKTTENDPREILPKCIVEVSKQMDTHSHDVVHHHHFFLHLGDQTSLPQP